MTFLITTSFLLLFCIIEGTYQERVEVQVEQGTLSGEVLQAALSNNSYISFKGIPYAKPPVGELRFRDPQPPVPWDGVRDATEHGATCPQVDLLINVYLPGSEDCLFLNVYTPQISNDTHLPVLVFIHGGVYKFGSGNIDSFGPDYFMNKTMDIVVVTINYRLDSLGQLCLNTKDVPGNAGLKDQVYALRWIQKNIKKFGGDPDNVTIMGESAGAASVSLHVLSPMSKGLFRRAIMESGVAICDWSIGYYPVDRAYALAHDNGFKAKNTSEVLSFLQNISYDKIINKTAAVLASERITDHPIKVVPFAPIVEQDFGQEMFMSESSMEALTAGHVNVEEVIIGYNGREATTLIPFTEIFIETYNRYPEFFVPNKILEKANSSTILQVSKKIVDFYYGDKDISLANMNEYIDYCSNFSFVYDIHRYTNKLLDNNVRVYFYKFDFITEWNYYANALGGKYSVPARPAHLDELFYLFYAAAFNQTFAENSEVPQIISMMTTLWSNFVKYGVPTPDTSSLGFNWPEYDSKEQLYFNAKNDIAIDAKPDIRDVEFAKELFESVGIPF